ncbi:MAG: rod-binding protein [bacterium]|nr:rod-binding protein [bacterium]
MLNDIQAQISAVRMRRPAVGGQNDLARLANRKNAVEGDAEKAQFNKELKVASDGFEEIFTKKMLQSMRSNVFKSDFISGGAGEEIFQDMLDENYSQLLTRTRSLGLSDWIYENTKKS